MKDLTIDVGILMTGSGIGNPDNSQSCNLLMKKTMATLNWCLALDKGGKIENQYGTKLGQGTFGHHWLLQMASRDKIKYVTWRSIDRGTITQLKEAHFDKEDFKYVRTAEATVCKIIVSHDPDYSNRIRRILRRRLDVVVNDSEECLCIEQ